MFTGQVYLSSDPNALADRLGLLLASYHAGNTGTMNEIVAISDELLRQRYILADDYKALNIIISI